jgi:hypothetical protein
MGNIGSYVMWTLPRSGSAHQTDLHICFCLKGLLGPRFLTVVSQFDLWRDDARFDRQWIRPMRNLAAPTPILSIEVRLVRRLIGDGLQTASH